MVRINEDLLRRSSEHNEGIISTLEEIALHQRDIEKIEWLDKWCRELKILDLTSNLIYKIENLGRLKKLEYLKLGLNNIEEIENLEGCESLQKLDLTVNFIGKLTSIETLINNEELREIYLVGNPCTLFENYRPYVVATLPQLEKLDGIEITKSERIIAFQSIEEITGEIVTQQINYQLKREKQKLKFAEENENHYSLQYENLNDEEKEKIFWSKPSEFTADSRKLIYEHKQQIDKKNQTKVQETKQERRLLTKEGRRLNINEPRLQFKLTEDDERNNLVLDVALFKYLDSSLCDVDVQHTYVQIIVKKKMLQLALPEDVDPERCKAERSKASGHLIITMPLLKKSTKKTMKLSNMLSPKQNSNNWLRMEKLEVHQMCKKPIDIRNICSGESKKSFKAELPPRYKKIPERLNNNNFVDDITVPPLE